MAIRQEFVFTPPPGKEFIDINIWARDLPDLERQEWLAAVDRQLGIRQKAIDQAALKVDDSNPKLHSYVWDEEAIKHKPPMEYKPYDEVWIKYWNRYLEETGTKFEVKEIKDDNSIQ
jgi:hypothetical protein